MSVICFIYFIGGIRTIWLGSHKEDNVKIASISVPHFQLWKDIHKIMDEEQDRNTAIENLNLRFRDIHEELFKITRREAENGAKIVQWHESNGIVFKEGEEEFINKGKIIAHECDIYLLMTVTSIDLNEKNDKNMAIMIGPDGNILYEYTKYKIVPGDLDIHGDGIIKYTDTPYGRISSIICFDGDFPQYVRQAGQNKVDILLVPSSDWEAIDPIHSEMATFRGIENGCSVVRQVQKGLSLSSDYLGNTISSMDYFTTDDKVLISNVPVRGVKTIYSYIGDLFSWICIILLIIIITLNIKNEISNKVHIFRN